MKRLFVPVLLMLPFISQGQGVADEVYDTARRLDPYSGTLQEILRNGRVNAKTDSSMLFVQQYDRTRKEHIGIQNLGDVHTPFIDLRFKPYDEMGMRAGLTPFTNLYFSADSARFYDSKLPYTEFHYAQGKGGQRGMIDFDALHTQNFGKQFNITALYHSTSNDGFYSRQSMSCKNIQVSTYFHSRNHRYTASGIATWNKTNMMENGGIEQSAATEATFKELGGGVRIVDVSLNQARNINRFRDHRIQQVYWLTMSPAADSSTERHGTLGISHGFQTSRNSNYYTDQAADFGFYDSVWLYNGKYSADSFALKQISNTIELFSPIRAKGLSFRAGVRHDRFTAFASADAGNYNRFSGHNNSVFAQFNFNLSKAFRSEVYGTFYPEGYNQGDYQLKWNNRTSLGPSGQWQLEAGAQSLTRKPVFRQMRMLSNHYRWDNDFRQTRSQTLSFALGKTMKRPAVYNAYYYTLPSHAFQLRVHYTLMDAFVYYGADGKPAQGNDGQSSLQLSATGHLNLKWLQVHQELVLQRFSKPLERVVQLPAALSKTSLYYQTFAFKKASFLQIGFDAVITSSYRAGLYNPALQNFRLSEKSVGAYPFIDFFINAEVKTARIFFKIEHLNQDLLSDAAFPNYLFSSPYQPSAPRRFRLGFIWKFYY